MLRSSEEYLLEELLEHPVIGIKMTSEGIERRCLDLMFDAARDPSRFCETEIGKGPVCSIVP
jgi:hypothetical protein